MDEGTDGDEACEFFSSTDWGEVSWGLACVSSSMRSIPAARKRAPSARRSNRFSWFHERFKCLFVNIRRFAMRIGVSVCCSLGPLNTLTLLFHKRIRSRSIGRNRIHGPQEIIADVNGSVNRVADSSMRSMRVANARRTGCHFHSPVQ